MKSLHHFYIKKHQDHIFNMKKAAFLFVLLTTLYATAQDEISKGLGTFSEIKVYDAINVILVRSDKNEISISGKRKDDVKIVLKDKRLKIRMDLDNSYSGEYTDVTVFHTEKIDLIDVNEGAKAESDNTFSQYDLELRAQEGGEITVTLDTKRLDVRAVTGGSVNTEGKSEQQEIEVNTGGSYDGKDLITEQTDIRVSAGGYTQVHTTKYIKARVRAGGTINVYGDPEIVDKDTTFGGSIIIN